MMKLVHRRLWGKPADAANDREGADADVGSHYGQMSGLGLRLNPKLRQIWGALPPGGLVTLNRQLLSDPDVPVTTGDRQRLVERCSWLVQCNERHLAHHFELKRSATDHAA
jgi:hypothetical protein